VKTLEASNAHLTAEAGRLRGRVESAEILREEKRELERRVEGVEELRRRVAELETVKERLEREVKEKEVEVGGVLGGTSGAVVHQLTEMRKTHASLLDVQGELKASLRVAEIELADAREENNTLQSELERIKREKDGTEEEVGRKERERKLLEKEVVFLKSLVASYKDESATDISMNMAMSENNSADASVVMRLENAQVLERQVAELEQLLSEYKRTINTLESEVERLTRSGGGLAGKSQGQWEQVLRKVSELDEGGLFSSQI
jgi:mitotic spindle assembly checkpoint protein MAD1